MRKIYLAWWCLHSTKAIQQVSGTEYYFPERFLTKAFENRFHLSSVKTKYDDSPMQRLWGFFWSSAKKPLHYCPRNVLKHTARWHVQSADCTWYVSQSHGSLIRKRILKSAWFLFQDCITHVLETDSDSCKWWRIGEEMIAWAKILISRICKHCLTHTTVWLCTYFGWYSQDRCVTSF